MIQLIDWKDFKYITAIEYATLKYKKLQENMQLDRVSNTLNEPAVYIVVKDNKIVHVGSAYKSLHRRAYDHTRVSRTNATSCLNNSKTSKMGKDILGVYKIYYIKESIGLDKDNLSNLEANIGEVFNPQFDTSYRKIDGEKFSKKLKILFKKD